MLSEHFPAGASDPLVLLVPPGQAAAASAAAHVTPGVGEVTSSAPVEGYDSYSVVLSADPFGSSGTTAIAGLRQRLAQAAPGALVGGNPAIAYDEAQTAGRDDLIIVPLVLAVILVVMGLLLQAVVAPVVLVLTTALSFAAAFGLSNLLWHGLGYAGVESVIPIYIFIFLVALGVDYNIFLSARIRAESRQFGLRDGTLRGLNAAYAADGYARIRGAAILCTTYAVGELSALNGVMGSYAERLPVFHLVGQPSSKLQRARPVTHHSLGDGMFRQFQSLSAASVCVTANLTPSNAIAEMERVITEALAQRRPAYITVAEDYASLPVIGTPVAGVPLAEVPRTPSDPASLDAAIAAITKRVAAATSTVVLPAYPIGRFGLQQQLTRFLDATSLAYATTPMDKAQVSETNPHFLGMYAGMSSSPGVQAAVEGAGLVLNLGGVAFADFNTGEWTEALDPDRMITVWPDYVQAGGTTFGTVYLADVLERLTETLPKTATPRVPARTATPLPGAAADRVTSATLYPRLARFLRADDIVIAETGLCVTYTMRLPFPEGAVFHNQTLWGSIGWATPAAFGAAMADTSRRTVLVTGDGSHQLTANDIGAMGRYGAKPVIILLNNSMYGVEEVLSQHQGHVYNFLAPWNYYELPAAFGCTGWYAARVTTVGELDAALAKASQHDNGCYLEIMLGRSDIPASLPDALLDMLYQTAPTDAVLPAIASAAAEVVNGSGQPS